MKSAKVRSAPDPGATTVDRSARLASCLRLAAVAILLLAACSRMLLTESLSPPWVDFTGGSVHLAPGESPGANHAKEEPIEWAGPTPASSMGLAIWIGLAAVLWAIAQAKSPQPIVGRWGLVFIGIFAAGAAVSLAVASNKAAARNNSVQFLGWLVSFWLLVQLLRTRRMRQAAAVLVLAAGVIFAGYTIYQNFVENPDFIRNQWPKVRTDYFARQGWNVAGSDTQPDLLPPMARMWEERVASAEAKGFAVNANIAAALLVVVTMASIGWAAQKLAGPRAPLWAVFAGLAVAVAALLLVAMLLTRSRGAISSGILAMLAFAAVGWKRRWASAHWRGLAIGLAAVVLAGAMAVAGWSARMSQPEPDSFWYRKNAAMSMLFRWQYWVGSAGIVRDQPLGVGGGNSRDAYVARKLPAALEDVDNPHNFAVTALVEYGPLGAIGLVGLLAWGLIVISRPGTEEENAKCKMQNAK